MVNRSMVWALPVWWLTGTMAFAQFGLPQAGMVPGPITPWQAPPGPSDELSLPADTRNAFDPPSCEGNCTPFITLGSFALMRQRMGQAGLALDSNGLLIQEFDDVRTNFIPGGRGAVGVVFCCSSIELTGFFQPEYDSVLTSFDPNGIQTFFQNSPIGILDGQPPYLRTTLTSDMGNVEANYRVWSLTTGPEFIFGCRFLNLEERLTILGDQTGFVVPAQQEFYISRTVNRIVGPTLGIEWGVPVGSSMALTFIGKGTWGWNFVEANTILENGFGQRVFDFSNDRDIFSHIYEVGAYVDVWLGDPIHVRLGCQALWLVDVAEAVDQVDFNLANNPNGRVDNHGSILYWGPVAEVQILF